MAAPSAQTFDFSLYEYTSLPSPSSIRLLSPVDDSGCPQKPKICGNRVMQYTLKSVDLNDDPDYDALSYTWGNPYPMMGLFEPSTEYATTNRWPIAVNGKLFFITKNLFDALAQLNPGTTLPDVHERYRPFNKTELIRASEEGRGADVRSQLDHGAMVNARDIFGETSLHYAAENGHFAIVEMLLQSGADATLLDLKARTPLACCLQRERREWKKVAERLKDPATLAMKNPIPKPRASGWALQRPIWIDAVCINQNDIPERNAQVTMMARIYRSAQQVKVWLGPEEKHAPSWIDRLAADKKGKSRDPTESLLVAYAVAHSHALVSSFKTDESQIKRLFYRTWFSRTWIIQELALARSVQVLCGTQEFDWTYLLEHVLKDLTVFTNTCDIRRVKDVNVKSMLGTDAKPCVLADAWVREGAGSTERQYSARTTDCVQGKILPGVDMRLSLPILLALTRDFQASDPRDKIFAILGLARFSGHQRITVDYSRSVVDLYTEVGRIFVEASGNNEFQDTNTGEMQDLEPLEGLSFVQQPVIEHDVCHHCTSLQKTPDLPSWVPDFKNPLVTPPLFCKRFQAAASSQYTTYQASDRILRLSGGIFDRIAETEGKSARSSSSGISDSRTWLDLISRLEVTYPTGIDRVEALWRTLTLDRAWTSKAEFRKEVCEQLQEIRAKLGENAVDLELLQRLATTANSDLLPAVAEIEATTREVDGTTTTIGFYTRMRRLFRTDKGFLGLGPDSVRAGDQVWILAGARVPFVLRDVSTEHGPDSFELVGESYVHGIMQGEAVAAEDVHFSLINLV